MRPTKKDIERRLRQVLRKGRIARRELTLEPKYQDDQSCLDASGAIKLTINDILPTLNNSLDLPPGLEVEMGVTGDHVWPVSINDVEMEEEDEVHDMSDQSLGFAKNAIAEPVRTGITVEVSNRAIDSAGFDLLGWIQKKFQLAQRRYIASHLYSSAIFDGNNGPFSGEHASQWTVLSTNPYDSIIQSMTLLEQMGFDTGEAVIIIDPPMEVKLKTTPIRTDEGRMIIEGDLCAGYPYIVNNYFNTKLDENCKLVRKEAFAIGIGIFKWFKIAQHGTARLTIDGKSENVAKRNVTSVTLNTAWSFTDLSKNVNGDPDGLKAFHTLILRRQYLADCNVKIFRTSDGKLLRVGNTTIRP
jgi:hypothetical protein